MSDAIEISLTKGYVAIIDRADEHLSAFNWRARTTPSGAVYAFRTAKTNGIKRTIYLHIEIMGDSRAGLYVDHIDGDGLNNRRRNLRYVEPTINQRNRGGAARNSKSGILGVSWQSRRQRWRAQIRADGRKIDLGSFATIEEANAARLAAEAKYWGIQPRRANAHASPLPANPALPQDVETKEGGVS